MRSRIRASWSTIATEVVFTSTFTTTVGLSAATIPRVANVVGSTTPGAYPQSRNADSYSAITPAGASRSDGGIRIGIPGLRVRARSGASLHIGDSGNGSGREANGGGEGGCEYDLGSNRGPGGPDPATHDRPSGTSGCERARVGGKYS